MYVTKTLQGMQYKYYIYRDRERIGHVFEKKTHLYVKEPYIRPLCPQTPNGSL